MDQQLQDWRNQLHNTHTHTEVIKKSIETQRLFLTQFDENLPLQVRDQFCSLVHWAAESHLWSEQLQGVADHVVDVDGERVVFGPIVDALLPPDVALQTQWRDNLVGLFLKLNDAADTERHRHTKTKWTFFISFGI